MSHRVLIWSLAGLVAGPLVAQEPGDSTAPALAPLFTSHDPLILTIEAPLDHVLDERSEEDPVSYDAVLHYQAPGGMVTSFDIKLRTRGSFRLQERICGFPPLRVNFRKTQVEGTVFAGQDRIKMVTHCQDRRDEYEQYLLLEYLVYRTYRLFTEVSFRVRLAHITYLDTDGERDPITKYAFFIEDADAMAARNGWNVLEVPAVLPDQMQQGPLVLFEVFQFMMANGDFDPFAPEPGDYCCHNTLPIGSLAQFVVVPVPYDFDWAGIVAPPYARPHRKLRVRSVQERRYWGICRPREEIEAVFPLFNERREVIFDLFRSQADLDPDRLQNSVEMLDEFYEVINDPDRVERDIMRKCRPDPNS
jgi:hypothetical protein